MTKHFEGNNFLGRLLRFLNVVEPDAEGLVLSISRLSMWIGLATFVAILVWQNENWLALASALIGTGLFKVAYTLRRRDDKQ